MVVGDIVLANLPYDKQGNFLREIKRLLKNRGDFVTRLCVIPDNWQNFSFDEILERFSRLPLYKNESTELLAYLHNTVWDPKSKKIKLNKVRNGLQKYWTGKSFYHKNHKVKKLLNDIWQAWKPMDKEWAVDYEERRAEMVSRYFKILERKTLSDSPFEEINKSFPIWLCRVKRK